MFGKRCQKCGNRIKSSFIFCPYCSKDLRSKYDDEDYGFLGRNDLIENNFTENDTDAFIEKMFNSAMKMLEKQMRHFHNVNKPGLNVQFFVNGEKVFPEKYQPAKTITFSKEKLKKFAELPKKEPKSNMKRIAGKVIYELFVPGVETINDVLINRLENSIEVKALAEDKVYSKNIKVNLPILRYSLINDSLVIEMLGK